MSPFDVESTGTDVENDRIVTATVMTIIGSTPRVRSWLINPGIDIPAEATAVHGITTEHARAHGTPAPEAIAQIRQALVDELYAGRPLVIFNAPFDTTMLDRECRRYGIEPLGAARVPLRVIDPLVLDRATNPYRKGSRKLVDVARHHGITLTEDAAHTSDGDCLATGRVAWCIGKRTPAGRMDIDQLQAYQRQAHSRWAANFESYLRKQKTADANRAYWDEAGHAAACLSLVGSQSCTCGHAPDGSGVAAAQAVHIPRHWPIVPFELVGAEA
jgi:DNA polymerase-3 subunit epsilon